VTASGRSEAFTNAHRRAVSIQAGQNMTMKYQNHLAQMLTKKPSIASEMKQKACLIGLTTVLFLTQFCLAQDNEAKLRFGHNPSNFPVLYSIDYLSILDSSAIRKINLTRGMIKKIQIEKDTVFGYNHKIKYVGIIKISTKKKYNSGIKYLTQFSGDWMKEHPLSLFMLDDKLLQDDVMKYNLLSKIIAENIKGIELSQPDLAIKKYGPIAFDGVFIIKTK
jgi:hypothetical protein